MSFSTSTSVGRPSASSSSALIATRPPCHSGALSTSSTTAQTSSSGASISSLALPPSLAIRTSSSSGVPERARAYPPAMGSRGGARIHGHFLAAEAAIVRALLERGIRHRDVRRAIDLLRGYGEWPLSQAPLATTRETRPRIVLRENGDAYELADRGWQLMAQPPGMEDVRLRL